MRLEMMNKSESRILYLALLVAPLCLSARATVAQSTLVTIPSTDVISARKVYLEFDYISHYASHHNGGFQSYVPRVASGTTSKSEST